MWSFMAFVAVILVISCQLLKDIEAEKNGMSNTVDLALRKETQRKCVWKNKPCRGGDCCKGYECVMESYENARCKKKSKCKKNDEDPVQTCNVNKNDPRVATGGACNPANNGTDCCSGNCVAGEANLGGTVLKYNKCEE